MSQKTIQLSFFIILTISLFILSFFILKPYLGVIFLASVFAVVFHPLYQKLLLKFNNKSISSLLTVSIISICILIPAILLSASLLKEAIGLYNSLAFGGGTENIISQMNVLLSKFDSITSSNNISSYLSVDVYARNILSWIIGHFDSVFSVVFGGLFNFVLMLLSLYYLLIYGEKIKTNLIVWSPLPDNYDEDVINVLRSSVDSVMRGRLLVSVAQGFFLGLGFIIFGVGNPVLWGFVAGIASLIPILGTAIVTLPVVIYMFITGSVGASIGLLIWGVLCVGLIDNVLSFFFFKHRIKIHPLVILFSILGGVEIFGPIGFLIGPIAISAFLALMKIYPFIMAYKNKVLIKQSDEQ